MQVDQIAVSGLMSLPVLTVAPNARAQEVLAVAELNGVHHFPIVGSGKLVGLVCTCDLQELQPEANVLQVAWRHVVTLPPNRSLGDAARLMAIQGVGSIVLVDRDVVCGIITREDLIEADPELDKLLCEARCAACGTRRHLRPGPDGQCLCQDCQVRAREGAWLEQGGGD